MELVKSIDKGLESTKDEVIQIAQNAGGSFLEEFDPNQIPKTKPQGREQEENKEVLFDKMSRYYGYTRDFLENTLTMNQGMDSGRITPTGLILPMAYSNLKTGYDNAANARDVHLNEITGNRFKRNVNTIDPYTQGTFGMNVAFGFADTQKEYTRNIKNHLTQHPDGRERDLEVIKDDREDKPWYLPTYYVSVEKDDGTMTEYSNPMQDISDFAARAAGQTAFDVGFSITEAGYATAMAVGSATATSFIPYVGPVLAPIVGTATFLTSAYTAGVGYERTREKFVKSYFNLNDEEATSFMDFVQEIGKLTLKNPALQALPITADAVSGTVSQLLGREEPYKPFDYNYKPVAETVNERISGLISTGGLALGRAFEKIGNMRSALSVYTGKQIDEMGDLKSGVNVKGGFGLPIFKQIALYAQPALAQTRPGGKFGYLGVPLNDFVLTTFTPSRIIGRLGALAQQTSLVIPDQLKKQAGDLIKFFRSYKQNRVNGTVDYEDFQKPYEQLRDFYIRVSKGMEGSYSELAADIGAMDNLFGKLRFFDAKIKYDDAFQAIGNAPYDLTDIREHIFKKVGKNVIPVPADKKKLTKRKAVKDTDYKEEGAYAKEGFHLKRMYDELLELGIGTGKSKRLTEQQIKVAVEKFTKDNAEFLPEEFIAGNVRTPAELLHSYAMALSNMKSMYFVTGQNKLANEARELRDILMNKIVNPLGKKPDELKKIQPLLTEANKFWSETEKIRGKSDWGASWQDKLRLSLKDGTNPGVLLNDLLGTGTKPMKKGESVIEFSNFKEMTKYFQEKLAKFDIEDDMFDEVGYYSDTYQKLRFQFASHLYKTLAYNIKIKRTDPGDPTFIKKFFDSFDKDQKLLLGIDEKTEKYFIDTAEDFEFMFDKDLMDKLKAARGNQKTLTLMHEIFGAGPGLLDENFKRLTFGDKAEDFFSTLKNQAAEGSSNIEANNLINWTEMPGVTQALQNRTKLRSAIFEYLLDPTSKSGVTSGQIGNNATRDAAEDYINIEAFEPLLKQIKGSKTLSGPNGKGGADSVFTEEDMELFEIIRHVGHALHGAGKADAGTALAGAQIISELFTIDGKKLLNGISRLIAQDRVSKLLTDQRVIQLLAGSREKKNQKSYIRGVLFGKGMLADLVTKILKDNTEEEAQTEDADDSERIEELFEQPGSGFSSLFDQTNQLMANSRNFRYSQ